MDKMRPISATGTESNYYPPTPPWTITVYLNTTTQAPTASGPVKCQCSLCRGGMHIATQPLPSVHQSLLPKLEESLRNNNQTKSQSRLPHGHNNTNAPQRPPFALTSVLRTPPQQHKTPRPLRLRHGGIHTVPAPPLPYNWSPFTLPQPRPVSYTHLTLPTILRV